MLKHFSTWSISVLFFSALFSIFLLFEVIGLLFMGPGVVLHGENLFEILLMIVMFFLGMSTMLVMNVPLIPIFAFMTLRGPEMNNPVILNATGMLFAFVIGGFYGIVTHKLCLKKETRLENIFYSILMSVLVAPIIHIYLFIKDSSQFGLNSMLFILFLIPAALISLPFMYSGIRKIRKR